MKFLIGVYIGTQGLESTYGAAASVVALLIWIYYSAQIVLFGAELTHARAIRAPAERLILGQCQTLGRELSEGLITMARLVADDGVIADSQLTPTL